MWVGACVCVGVATSSLCAEEMLEKVDSLRKTNREFDKERRSVSVCGRSVGGGINWE